MNVQEQALSAVLPPVTTAKMNQTAPELNHYRLITTVFPSHHSDSNVDDQSTLSQKNNHRRVTRLKKFKRVAQRYKDLIILVLKSIVPDLKTFNWWQAVLLILFASFNVIFSVLVSLLNSNEKFNRTSYHRSVDRLGFQFFGIKGFRFISIEMDKRFELRSSIVASNSSMFIGSRRVH